MISPPHSGSWIWGPERGGGGRTPSPSEHRAQPSPAASASASLPVSAEPHPLPSSPPSRLSSGKLQEFGVGDGSKLTLVPTVEAGLMVNGWGPVPWRLRRGRAAPSRQDCPVTHTRNPRLPGKPLQLYLPTCFALLYGNLPTYNGFFNVRSPLYTLSSARERPCPSPSPLWSQHPGLWLQWQHIPVFEEALLVDIRTVSAKGKSCGADRICYVDPKSS